MMDDAMKVMGGVVIGMVVGYRMGQKAEAKRHTRPIERSDQVDGLTSHQTEYLDELLQQGVEVFERRVGEYLIVFAQRAVDSASKQVEVIFALKPPEDEAAPTPAEPVEVIDVTESARVNGSE